MEKIKEYLKGKLPNSQFTVYDDYTVLQLIWKLIIPSVNGLIGDLNTKTDLVGDHKGSWHGVEYPTLCEEGISGLVMTHEKYLKDNQISIKEFMTIEHIEDMNADDTEILNYALSLGKFITCDLLRPLNISDRIVLKDGSSLIGVNGKININSEKACFKLTRKNIIENFDITMKTDLYQNSLFEVSSATINTYGECYNDDGFKHNLETRFKNIKVINDYAATNELITHGDVFLFYADDSVSGQKGFWNIKVEDINLTGYMVNFCRNYVDKSKSNDPWITDVKFTNCTIYGAKYGFFGTKSEETKTNFKIKDIEALWLDTISHQCWKSKNCCYFTTGFKTIRNLMTWDWQYALTRPDGNLYRPISLQNNLTDSLSAYGIHIDVLYPNFLASIEVDTLPLDSAQGYSYINKSVAYQSDSDTKQITPNLLRLRNGVNCYKIAEFKKKDGVPQQFAFTLYMGAILGYKGTYDIQYRGTLEGDRVYMSSKGASNLKNAYGVKFYFDITNGICSVYMETTVTTGLDTFFLNDNVLSSIDLNNTIVPCYPQHTGTAIPNGKSEILVLESSNICVVNSMSEVSTFTKNQHTGFAVLDMSTYQLNIKVDHYNNVWKKVQLS